MAIFLSKLVDGSNRLVDLLGRCEVRETEADGALLSGT